MGCNRSKAPTIGGTTDSIMRHDWGKPGRRIKSNGPWAFSSEGASDVYDFFRRQQRRFSLRQRSQRPRRWGNSYDHWEIYNRTCQRLQRDWTKERVKLKEGKTQRHRERIQLRHKGRGREEKEKGKRDKEITQRGWERRLEESESEGGTEMDRRGRGTDIS